MSKPINFVHCYLESFNLRKLLLRNVITIKIKCLLLSDEENKLLGRFELNIF